MKQVDQAIADLNESFPLLFSEHSKTNNTKRPRITFPLQTLMARQSKEEVITKLLACGSITFWGEAREDDIEWTNTLPGIVYMDTLEASAQAKYLVTYALPAILFVCGMVALTMVFQMMGGFSM